MSIQVNPNKQPVSQNPVPLTDPPKGFMQRWGEMYLEGYNKEVLPAYEYCTRGWIQKTGVEPSEVDRTSKIFQDCIADCLAHKQFCEWHRRN